MAREFEHLGVRPARSTALTSALRLEYFSLAWNVAETGVGLGAGIAAGSVALVGFGLDSVAESTSAAVLVWRLQSERAGGRTAEEVESRAVRLVGIAFFVLAAYIGVRAVYDLAAGSRPDESIPGMVLAALSIVVMPLLARAKRRAARSLDSRAMQADSFQTWLCTYLSVFLLAGLLANSVLGWWWADPVAALAIAVIAVREGRELWTAEDVCCS